MVDKELLEVIKQKKKTTVQAIYDALKKIRKEHDSLISKEEAAYIYAIRNKIDVHKFLKNDPNLHQKIMDLVRQKASTPIVGNKSRKISKHQVIHKLLKINETTVDDALLPNRIIEDAKAMSEIYPLIYIFENSVRNFIKKVLDKAYPNGWWNIDRITKNPFERAEGRKSDEGNKLWHGKRTQSSMLDYLDLDELESVINKNTEKLTPYFKDQPKQLDWLKIKIKEIYPSRNILAHNNPLSKDDIDRVKVICRDWNKQLPALKQKLEE